MWYLGRIKLFGVSDSWKRVLPAANFLFKYNKKDTGNMLAGDEALELSPANYGATSGGSCLSRRRECENFFACGAHVALV